jgi:NTP pyrophosphatase (non-canonical NTP hydrolase)
MPAGLTTMTPVDAYERLAMRTEADQGTILTRMAAIGENAMRLDNAARGLADECGEVSSVVKKHIEYGQSLNVVNLKEEVGDCLWRLAQLCKAGGFTLQQAMDGNLRKLRVRYPEKYSDQQAAEAGRDRAAEAAVMSVSDDTTPAPVYQDGHGFGHADPGEMEQLPPWQKLNVFGMAPGGLCCQRAMAKVCYDHNVDNYCPDTWRVHHWKLVQTSAGTGKRCIHCGKVDHF